MTTIDITLDPPNPLTDSQATYNSKALAFTQALNPWAAKVNTVAVEINADKLAAGNSATAAADSATAAADEKTLAQGFAEDAAEQAALAAAAAGSAVNAPGTSATSTTPRTVGTGTLTLTIQTGKAYAVGQFVVVASTASPENYMSGQVTAHDAGTGALTVNVTRVGGSGSFSAWTVSVVGAPAASGATSGVATQEISADLTLTSTSARYQAISSTAENLSILLPAATGLSVGGELFTLENTGMYPLPVRDSDGSLQAIVQPGQIALVYLKDNSTAAGVWAVDT